MCDFKDKEISIIFNSVQKRTWLMNEYLKSKIEDQIRIQSEILENYVRLNAIPKIKGKLTKGKMRWRGLQIIAKFCTNSGFNEIWIEQRGKRITPIINTGIRSESWKMEYLI